MSQRASLISNKLSLAVFIVLTVWEFSVVAFVDTTTRRPDRIDQPFELHDIPPGTVITQQFEAGAGGLDEIRLEGRITAGARPAVLSSQIVELDAEGRAVGVVREAQVTIAADATACCVVRFEPVADSRWRSYRFDLTIAELRDRQLSLRVAPARAEGRLTLNGRLPRANLVFRARAVEGTALARLWADSWLKSLALATLALIYNALLAAVVALATASDPQRA